MAEHELCKLGVTGSTPVASTRGRTRLRREAGKVAGIGPERMTGRKIGPKGA